MSLGIGTADDNKEEIPSYTQEEVEEIIKLTVDYFRIPRINRGLTWKGEHTFELGDDPARSNLFGLFPYGKLPAHLQPEPSATTTTTTTTEADDGLPYTMKSRMINLDFPAITPEAEPNSTTTAGETKAVVSMTVREAPTFDLGYPDSDDDSIPELIDSIPDYESKPNTTATTVTTTSSATVDTNPSLLICHREGTKTEALCRELQDVAPDAIIFSSSMLRYLKADDLPARFEDPVGGGVGAPVATAVVVASTPTETKASETEDLYAALDQAQSAWKQARPQPWLRYHFDAHLLRPTPTPQDQEAMRKVGLPSLGWMCTTCSRYFDYPSTVCAHAWRPCWPGRGPTVEEVD